MSSKSSHQSAHIEILSLSSDEEEEDDHLDVQPPVGVTGADCASEQQPRRHRGPRLSASGTDEADALSLLDDDESEEDVPLAERLMNRRSKGAAAVEPAPTDVLQVATKQQRTVQHDQAASQALPRRRPNEATKSLANLRDSSDEDSCCSSDDSIDKKLTACRKPLHEHPGPNLGDAFSSDDTEDGSCSEDSLSKRIKQMARPKSKPMNASKALGKHASDNKGVSEDSHIDCDLSQSSSTAAVVVSKPKRRQPDAATRAHQQQNKEDERLRKQQERDQAKLLKDQDKLAKKRTREAKLAADKTEKRRKQELKDDNKQKKGGFANQEIVVLMDPDLFRHPELTIADELQDLKYNVVEHASMLGCNAIQYIRKDLNRGQGGAEGAIAAMRAGNASEFKHLPVVAIVFDDAQDFIKLLERDDYDDDDYPKLAEWLQSVHAGWRAAWRGEHAKKPRILIYLFRVMHKLEHLWIEHKRSKRPNTSAPPSDEELKDAMAWLLIQFDVECIECRENDHLTMELNRLTGKLSDLQYQKAFTDLDISQKLAPLCGAEASLYAQAKDCWLRQVQQLPRVSFSMARTFVRHYPTGHSLWTVYQDVSKTEDEKRCLLVDCFGDKTCAKLSDQVYMLMTSDNPNFLLV